MSLNWPSVHTAGDFVVRTGAQLGPRVIEDHELVYFPSPAGVVYEQEGAAYRLDQPCVVFTRPSVLHAYRFSKESPTRHQFVHFALGATLEKDDIASNVAPLSPIDRMSAIPVLMHELLILAAFRPPHFADRCQAMLMGMVSHYLYGAPTADPDRGPAEIQHAKVYIEQHLHTPLTVAAIASAVGWSHGHFTRAFQRHLGMAPKSYIASRRIERACQLLTSSTSTIKEIAYSVGFADEHYFSRCFREQKGLSASEYRELYTDARSLHAVPTITWVDAAYPINTHFTFTNDTP